jgi:nitronate monooxygenase
MPRNSLRRLSGFARQPPGPVNLNFFAHKMPVPDNARQHAWRETLKPYYLEWGIDPAAAVPQPLRTPFDDAKCILVESLKPEVVSFHFGLPDAALIARVKEAGCRLIASATTVAEARWLEAQGCDAIIAQGIEAGGHRGMFMSEDVATQVGTFTLVPQVVDAVSVPVIAAGGIGDARGLAAAFVLGATGAQIGTAYLHCPESKVSPPHRAALRTVQDGSTVVTNVLSGRPARGLINRLIRELGPINPTVPAFPLASAALAPLNAKALAEGSGDFATMLAGQGAALGKEMPAGELTRQLAHEAQALLERMAG